ncbi:MAG: TraR/DksA family transcriptional regulator [Caldilineales bacterium]
MTKDDKRLERLLQAERAELVEAISHYEVLARQKKPGLGNHMADDATETFDQAANLALHRNETRLLAEVDAALARMERGDYGICQRCHEDIDFARLKAIPHAVLCIECQQHVEDLPRGNGPKR